MLARQPLQRRHLVVVVVIDVGVGMRLQMRGEEREHVARCFGFLRVVVGPDFVKVRLAGRLIIDTE